MWHFLIFFLYKAGPGSILILLKYLNFKPQRNVKGIKQAISIILPSSGHSVSVCFLMTLSESSMSSPLLFVEAVDILLYWAPL